jgi:hypothetical protein
MKQNHKGVPMIENEFKTVSRRDLLKISLSAPGLMVLAQMTPSESSAAPEVQVKSVISSNHGHAFTIALSALVANGAKVYDIKGSSSHNHQLNISAEAIKMLQTTKAIDIESETGSFHTHTVRLQLV